MNVLYKVLLATTFHIVTINAFAQAPPLQWQHNYGGNQADSSLQAAQNSNNDIFLAGYGYSTNQNLIGNAGSADIWLSKINPDGVSQWSHIYGGSLRDRVIDICPTQDNGVLLLCYAESIDGTFTNATNGNGVWVIKISEAGNEVFKNFYGGNPFNEGAILATSDGGFLFASNIVGTNGTVTSNGLNDIWLLKANSTGVPQWQRNLGGTNEEFPSSLLEKDNAYYVLGSSNSASVNSQTNHGDFDLIAAKYSTTGVIAWTQLFGGSNTDLGKSLKSFGQEIGYLGASKSFDGDVFGNAGGFDAWVFNTNINGSLGFDQYTIGQAGDDIPTDFFIEPFFEVPIILGTTNSVFDEGNPATPNVFLVQAQALGGTNWQTIYGGSGAEASNDLILLADGGFLITGQSTSSDGTLTTNFGASDMWAFKLHIPCPDDLDIQPSVITENFTRTSKFSITAKLKLEGSESRSSLDSPAILLQPGFEVSNGAVFKATPVGCN